MQYRFQGTNANGDLEHEYWRRQVARLYEGQGYGVHMEQPINGCADLVAQKQDESIAVEIETGKSSWRDNITRARATIPQAANNDKARALPHKGDSVV